MHSAFNRLTRTPIVGNVLLARLRPGVRQLASGAITSSDPLLGWAAASRRPAPRARR